MALSPEDQKFVDDLREEHRRALEAKQAELDQLRSIYDSSTRNWAIVVGLLFLALFICAWFG